jgi:hypothetical protein
MSSSKPLSSSSTLSLENQSDGNSLSVQRRPRRGQSRVEQQDVRRVCNDRWERFLDGVIEEFGAFDIDAMKRSDRWAV